MNKIITAGCMAVATFAAVAVPTKTELERARPVVENMTKADLAAYKAGEKTAQKVAAAHIDYAQKAEGEAAKYLLLQGAFKLYARSGEYDLAAEAIGAMKREIKDLPPAVIVEIVSDELRYVSDDKAPRLVAMLKEAKGAASATVETGEKAQVTTDSNSAAVDGKETVDGYTWSYRIKNGEAEIVAEKNGKFVCAVSPNPTGDVTIPFMLNGVKVTGIGQEAFCHYCGPKSVKIPDGVKSIGWCAFFRCTNLTAVTLPKSLKSIGHGAFADCSGLTSVVIPESVTEIEADAFRFCRRLKSVNIPTGVKHIKACTFDLCDSLTTITISDGVESFGRAAFYNCKTLGTLSIPSSVTNICEDAFGHCYGLKSVRVDERNPVYKCENGLLMMKDGTALIRAFNVVGHVAIPSGVKQIGAFAFCDICPELTSVTIPQSVTRIGAWAFANCGRITSISIPNAVTDIGDGAFYRTRIKSVTIPQNVKSIGTAFARCEALESVTISSGLTNIAISAFSGCSELKSFYVDSGNVCFSSQNGLLCSKDGSALIAGVSGDVTIPSGVVSIGPCAFGEIHKLRTLTIPASVTNISAGAFKYVARPFGGLELTTVMMHGEIPKMIGSDAFSNCPRLTKIHVPANVKSWAGMTEWLGKKLVFDAKADAAK